MGRARGGGGGGSRYRRRDAARYRSSWTRCPGQGTLTRSGRQPAPETSKEQEAEHARRLPQTASGLRAGFAGSAPPAQGQRPAGRQRAGLARRSRPPGPPRGSGAGGRETSKRSRGEQGGSEGRAGGEISGVGTAAGAEGSDPLKFGQGRAFVRLLGRGLRFKPGRGSFRQHWSRVGCVLGLRTPRGPS